MVNRLLPASILPGLLEIALKSRLNVQALFGHAGIDPDTVGRADCFIRLEQLDDVLSAAFEQAEDPFFGLRVGMDNHYGNLDLLGNLLATADTLSDALKLLLKYTDLIAPYLTFEWEQQDSCVALSCRSDETLRFTRLRTHHEVVVSTIVAIARSLVGGELGLQSVAFVHPEPEDLSVYSDFFAVPLSFDQPCNKVVIDLASLSISLPSAFPRYHQRLQGLADEQLVRLARAHGIVGQVLSLLQQRLGHEDLGVESIAGSLNMTARTLQRKLRAEEIAFITLRDQVRQQRACELLEGEQEMSGISEQLGFSDTANFYHAFKRWQGSSPGEYRKRSRQL